MILLAGLVKLPLRAIAATGVGIMALHNAVLPRLMAAVPGLGGLWKILYVGFWQGPIQFGPDGPTLIVLYSIIPWIGVMAAGFAFCVILALEPGRPDRICLPLGPAAPAPVPGLGGFHLDRRAPPGRPSGHGGV